MIIKSMELLKFLMFLTSMRLIFTVRCLLNPFSTTENKHDNFFVVKLPEPAITLVSITQSNYKVEQSTFMLIALFGLENRRCHGRN